MASSLKEFLNLKDRGEIQDDDEPVVNFYEEMEKVSRQLLNTAVNVELAAARLEHQARK